MKHGFAMEFSNTNDIENWYFYRFDKWQTSIERLCKIPGYVARVGYLDNITNPESYREPDIIIFNFKLTKNDCKKLKLTYIGLLEDFSNYDF